MLSYFFILYVHAGGRSDVLLTADLSMLTIILGLPPGKDLLLLLGKKVFGVQLGSHAYYYVELNSLLT